jgi:myosin protein heavy chain
MKEQNQQLLQQLSDTTSRFKGHERLLRQKESEISSLHDSLRKAEVERRSTNARLDSLGKLADENGDLRQQLTALSSTATSHESALRAKSAEVVTLHSALRKAESASAALDTERQSLHTELSTLQRSLRDLQSEFASLRTQKSHADRDAVDLRSSLRAKTVEASTAAKTNRQLEAQLASLRDEVSHAKAELNAERKAQNDVQMLVQQSLEKAVKELQQKLVEFEKSKTTPASPRKDQDATVVEARIGEVEFLCFSPPARRHQCTHKLTR